MADPGMVDQVSPDIETAYRPVLQQLLALAAASQAGPHAVQSTSSDGYDPRRQEIDRAELDQLARMMPDPEEDELFDDGNTFTHKTTASMVSTPCLSQHTIVQSLVK